VNLVRVKMEKMDLFLGANLVISNIILIIKKNNIKKGNKIINN